MFDVSASVDDDDVEFVTGLDFDGLCVDLCVEVDTRFGMKFEVVIFKRDGGVVWEQLLDDVEVVVEVFVAFMFNEVVADAEGVEVWDATSGCLGKVLEVS